MNHHKLVLPEHMNHHNSLFGGYMLKWIDEFAYITANIDYPGNKFVTISMENTTFKHRIACGQILCFTITENKRGKSSVKYDVNVYDRTHHRDEETVLVATHITFVNVDENNEKKTINK